MTKLPKEVHEKLRKLLAFKDSVEKANSVHELENVTARIHELLMKYNLELSDLQLDEETIYEKELHDLSSAKTEGRWRIELVNMLAYENFCHAIFNFGFKGRTKAVNSYWLYGKNHNIEIVKFMIAQLMPKIYQLGLDHWKRYGGLTKKNTFLRAFRSGVVMGIGAKIREGKEEQIRVSPELGALVHKESLKIKEFIQKDFDNLKTGKSSKLSGKDALYKGFEVGKGLNVHKGIADKNGFNQNLLK